MPTLVAITNGFSWATYAGAIAILVVGAVAANTLVVHHAADGSSRRGIKGLVIGADGRTSTSKLNALLWTLAIGFALLALILEGALDQVGENLQEEYLLLLGGPYAAAIGARFITSSKVNDGKVEKTKATDSGAGARLSEIISDDDGNVDLGDFQYTFFTLIGLLFFLVAFIDDPSQGLPEMPGTLVGLGSASALAYVTKKGAYSDKKAQIFSASPTRVMLGRTPEIQINGVGFLSSPGGASEQNSVLLDGVMLEDADWQDGSVKAILSGSAEDLMDMGLHENQQADLIVSDNRGRTSDPFKVWVEKPPNP